MWGMSKGKVRNKVVIIFSVAVRVNFTAVCFCWLLSLFLL